MDVEDKLQKACRESMEYMGSISALELMENAGLFMRNLNKLVNSQKLPAAILIGCLMQEIYRLSTDTDNVLHDDRLIKAFGIVMKSADERFMKKEQM